jgi:predicted nucleic acid-binding protein
MNSVFIETTIPSYYYETRTSPTVVAWRSVTREWWDHYRHEYRLFTSRFVLAELARAPAVKARKTARLLKKVEVLDEPPGLQDVVEYYIEHKLMPVESGGDAFHLAMASLHSLDFLLTWNCLHLANANKVRHLEILNGRLKLPVPIITTPLTLIPETEE